MKYFFKLSILVVVITLFTACQGNNSTNNRSLITYGQKNGVNPNSLAYRSHDKVLDRQNKIDMAQIEANSKLEVAKIESKKAVEIAKIDSVTKKDVSKQEAQKSIEISKIDSLTRDKENMIKLYIAIGAIIVAFIGIFVWFHHKRKSLELQMKVEDNRLKHQLMIKEKELQEERIQKVLDLAISGKLPPELQKDFIASLTHQNSKLIESK